MESADWSADGSFLLYASVAGQTGDEDLFTAGPDGTNEQNLTESLSVRERAARIDPVGRTAAYEHVDADGVSRIYVFRETPVTSGPATGPALPGTPYVVGSDASPTFSPDSTQLVFRRLTGVGNGGLGTLGPDGDHAHGGRDRARARERAALPRRPGLEQPRHRVRRDGRDHGHVAARRRPAGWQRANGATDRAAGYRMGAPRWLP